MFTQTSSVFSLFLVAICLFSACQKNDIIVENKPSVVVPSIYAHMEDNFYTQRIGSYGYVSGSTSFNNKDTADIDMRISVQNDTLMVLGYEFPIDSLNQTSFSRIWMNPDFGDPQEVRLDYYNNYDSVKFFYSSCGSINGCRTNTYKGTKGGNIKKRFTANLYKLKVVHEEYIAAIDTQYTADLVVNFDGQTFEIGMNRFSYNPFYSYSNEYKLSTGNYGSSKKLVYMKNDSLYIDYYEIKYNNDTIYYSYQGVKK